MNFKFSTFVALLIGRALAETECWSTSLGYPCCQSKDTTISLTESGTGNQYGIENGRFCGITDLQLCPRGEKYKCCKKCKVVYTDNYLWGAEHNEWCSIPYSCNLNIEDYKKTTTTTTTTTTVKPTTTTTTTTTTIEPTTTTTTTTVKPTTTTTTTTTIEPITTTTTTTVKPTTTTTTTIEPTITTTTTTTIEPTTTTTTTTTTNEPAEPTETIGQCAKEYEYCGGTEHPDAPTCCEQGSTCDRRYAKFHQCIPDYLYYQPPPPPPFNDGCARAYDYCGGNGYPNCCAPGFKCTLNSMNRMQCLEDPSQPPPQQQYDPNRPPMPFTTTTTTTTKPTPTECAEAYYPCGGSKFTDAPNCCKAGLVCDISNPSHFKCVPEDEAILVETTTIPTTTTTTIPKPTTTTTTPKPITTTTTTTITTKKTTTKITTTTTKASKPTDEVCVSEYGRCGGIGYVGPTNCCNSGYICVSYGEYYSQCVPE